MDCQSPAGQKEGPHWEDKQPAGKRSVRAQVGRRGQRHGATALHELSEPAQGEQGDHVEGVAQCGVSEPNRRECIHRWRRSGRSHGRFVTYKPGRGKAFFLELTWPPSVDNGHFIDLLWGQLSAGSRMLLSMNHFYFISADHVSSKIRRHLAKSRYAI